MSSFYQIKYRITPNSYLHVISGLKELMAQLVKASALVCVLMRKYLRSNPYSRDFYHNRSSRTVSACK